MAEKLKILILEDNPTDAELVQRELRNGGIDFSPKHVETEEDFVKELKDFAPDIILSDYSLPSFDGFKALEIVKKQASLIIFIIVTGSLSEEAAAESMKAGAWDYVVKEHLVRLVPALKSALERRVASEEIVLAEEREKKDLQRLKTFYDASFGREERILELKKKVKELEEKLKTKS